MALNPLPIYPAAGRYVLRLHRDSRPQQEQLFGRIEHVASGDRTDFATAADLLNWLARRAAHDPSPKDNP